MIAATVRSQPNLSDKRRYMSSRGPTADSLGDGWHPEVPITVPPLLLWPPRPIKVLEYLFGFPGLYFPWLTLYALIALGLWSVLEVAHADFAHMSAGWPLLLLAYNEAVAIAFYGTGVSPREQFP